MCNTAIDRITILPAGTKKNAGKANRPHPKDFDDENSVLTWLRWKYNSLYTCR